MRYEVAVQVVPGRHAAIVRDRRSWADLGAKLLPPLDRVYVTVRAGKNVWWEIYGDWHEDPAQLETEVLYSLLPERT